MTTNIKANYKEIMDFLELNKNKKVSTIMPLLLEMTTSKTMAKTFKTNDLGEVTHIFCYYHKEWEALSEVDYGKKASSTTKYNTMCKEGLSMWSKQQRESKKAQSSLLDRLSSGDLLIADLEDEKALIESARTVIVPRDTNVQVDQEEATHETE